jgi:hypothetical protein
MEYKNSARSLSGAKEFKREKAIYIEDDYIDALHTNT